MKLLPLIAAFVLAAQLAGCSVSPVSEPASSSESVPLALNLDSDLFGERPAILSVSDIHALTDEQRLAFERYFNDPANQHRPPHKRVFDYLEVEARDFGYLGETYTAAEALETDSGNCLSLAILTTALAQLANVDIDYQLIDSQPVFESTGKLIRRSQHVRSILYDPSWEVPEGRWVVSRPRIAIDYYPGDYDRFVGSIEASEYFAMYYQNIAVDALDNGDLSYAYWLVRESLQYSPLSADSLNMLAIIFDRANALKESEEIYKFGIRHAERRVGLLRNYGLFLSRQGRDAEADETAALLAELDDPNPFDWIYAGQHAYRDGEFQRALRFFSKSVQLAPYLHEGHFGLAKTYMRLGDEGRAERSLERALHNASRPSARRLYSAKLAVLSAQSTP